MIPKASSEKRLLVIVFVGLLLLLVIVALLLHDDEEGSEGLTQDRSRIEQPKADERDFEPLPKRRSSSPYRERIDAVDEESLASSAADPVENKEAQTEEPEVPLVQQVGSLEVDIRFEFNPNSKPTLDRPEFLLILRPLDGLDERIHTRIARVRLGTTLVGDLPRVRWSCLLAGDYEREEMEVDLGSVEKAKFTRKIRRGELFLTVSMSPDTLDDPPKGMGLGVSLPSQGGRLLELSRTPQTEDLPPLCFGPQIKDYLVVAPGWLPTPLTRVVKARILVFDVAQESPSRLPVHQAQFSITAKSNRISGVVKNRGGEPIASALVTFSPGATVSAGLAQLTPRRLLSPDAPERLPRLTQTDVDGRFLLDVVPNAAGIIVVDSPEFHQPEPTLVVTGEAGEVTTVEISLEEGRSIVGMTEPKSAPIPTAIFHSGWFGALDPASSRARACRDGSYLVEGAPRGRFGLGLFVDPRFMSAAFVWTVEADHPAGLPLPTK